MQIFSLSEVGQAAILSKKRHAGMKWHEVPLTVVVDLVKVTPSFWVVKPGHLESGELWLKKSGEPFEFESQTPYLQITGSMSQLRKRKLLP